MSPLVVKKLSPVKIGPHQIDNPIVLAPMAGVTDRPFRQLCKNLGAGLAVSEMVGANSLLHGSEKPSDGLTTKVKHALARCKSLVPILT